MVPRAGLLGSIGAPRWPCLASWPLIETLRSPVVGFVTFGLLLYVLVAKGRLPVRIPGVLLAFIVGTALYYGLGLAGLGTPGFALPEPVPLRFTLPLPTLGFLDGLAYTVPYLPLLLPFGLLMVVGGINVSESARAAGDDYRTRDILLVEAVSTLVAGICGGVARPRRTSAARLQAHGRAQRLHVADWAVHRSREYGVRVGPGPVAAAACWRRSRLRRLDITVQDFHETPRKHAIAVALGFCFDRLHAQHQLGNPAWIAPEKFAELYKRNDGHGLHDWPPS